MASLQVSALKLGQGAYLRSQAVALGYEMLDTMRANRNDVLLGRYDWTIGTSPPVNPSGGALLHIRTWLVNVERALEPYNGEGGIDCEAARCTLTIRWDDRYASERAGPGEHRYETFRVVADL
jgi:Tfp pilus assembly protein PilV